MSNTRKLRPLDRRVPQPRQGRGRNRQPFRSVGEILAVHGYTGARLLAVGALGSAAVMALPAVAAQSAGSAGRTEPAASLTAQIRSAPLASSTGLSVLPNGKITSTPPTAQALPSASSPGEFVLPNGKITSDPAAAAAAQAPSFPPVPPGLIIYGPPAPGGQQASQPTDSPLPITGPIPVTFYVTHADGIGGMFSYTTDPSGQTGGSVSLGVLLGFGTNFGVRAGTPAPAGFDVSMPVTAMVGPFTGTGTWDITNSSVTFSGSVDGQTLAKPLWPLTQGSTGWSVGATYTQNSDGTWSVLPRGSVWGSANPQLTGGLAVTFPLPRDYLSQVAQGMNDMGMLEVGLLPQPVAPAQPAPPGTPLPSDGPTLDQIMAVPFAPTQGISFPSPTASDANSGLPWLLSQQPSSAGPSVQDIINTFPQTPSTVMVPWAALPPGVVYTGNPQNPFVDVFGSPGTAQTIQNGQGAAGQSAQQTISGAFDEMAKASPGGLTSGQLLMSSPAQNMVGPGNASPGNTGPGNTGPGNTGPGNAAAPAFQSGSGADANSPQYNAQPSPAIGPSGDGATAGGAPQQSAPADTTTPSVPTAPAVPQSAPPEQPPPPDGNAPPGPVTQAEIQNTEGADASATGQADSGSIQTDGPDSTSTAGAGIMMAGDPTAVVNSTNFG